MAGLKIVLENPEPGYSVIRLSGEWEGVAVLENKDKLLSLVEQNPNPNLMVDLAEIEYIDSAAVGALIEMAKKADSKKAKLVLVNLHPNVKKVLNIAHVDKLFTILGGY